MRNFKTRNPRNKIYEENQHLQEQWLRAKLKSIFVSNYALINLPDWYAYMPNVELGKLF